VIHVVNISGGAAFADPDGALRFSDKQVRAGLLLVKRRGGTQQRLLLDDQWAPGALPSSWLPAPSGHGHAT
jgi:hypothetical protein